MVYVNTGVFADCVRAPHLCYDVMNGLQHLLTIPIIDVYDSEMRLDDGRFSEFTNEPQEFKVALSAKPRYGAEFRKEARDMIEWLAQHATDPWSIDLHYEHMGKMNLIFSFANLTTAVVFKLVWYEGS